MGLYGSILCDGNRTLLRGKSVFYVRPSGLTYAYSFTPSKHQIMPVYALRIKHHLPIRMSDGKINLPRSKNDLPMTFCNDQLTQKIK